MTGSRLPFVLVADDDQDTRELYRACFDTNGYRTAEATTGSQAIVSAVEIVPDVLLTDFMLPDVDGLTIARRLKDDPRTAGIWILMVTGYATPDLERRAASIGVDRVLFKPALPQAVMREVSRTLARPVPPLRRPLTAERRDAPSRVRDEFGPSPDCRLPPSRPGSYSISIATCASASCTRWSPKGSSPARRRAPSPARPRTTVP